MTENPKTCSHCGGTLTGDAAGGLCPRCLMAMNFESRTMHPGEEPSGMPPLPPEEIADRFPGFEILECLGRGGMGVVYKARQKSLDRLVAIKILPPEGVGEEAFSERFAREAATLAKLSHPNIVTVHDFGETAGLFYIVMEYVDGVNLRDLLREGKLEAKQALAIVPPICEALQYAHDKGIVHRDIKPENLLLDRDGRVKIADFGIASLVGASGESAGTPPYMAPEQNGGRTDHRADIYALGVVLYEMLTGERPEKDVVAPSRKVHVDVRIDEMVLRALEKEPEMRYQTAVEFRTAVETMAPQAVPARSSSSAPASLLKTTEARVAWPATDSATGASLGVLTSPSVGSVELHSDRLLLRCGAEQRDIPLATLTACGEAIPPFWASPGGHRYAGVEFTDPASGQRQRLVFQTGAVAFSLPGDTALRAAEWLTAIRNAHQAATDRELPVWPAAWVFPLRGGPRLLPFVLFLILGCLLFLPVLTRVPLGLAEIVLLLFTPLFLALCILGGVLAVRAWSLNRRPLVQSSSPPPPVAQASGLTSGASPPSPSLGTSNLFRSLADNIWLWVALVAVILAFFNPWGSMAWKGFAAAVAILGVLSAMDLFPHRQGREKKRDGIHPEDSDGSSKPPSWVEAEESIRRRIQWPAVAMAVVGGINVAGCAFGLFVALLLTLVPLEIGTGLPSIILPPWAGSPLVEGMIGGGSVTGTVALMMLMAGWMLLWLGTWVFAFVSALRMRQMKSRGWAIAAAIIFVAGGLIGFVSANSPTPGLTDTWSMIELGVGIWALVSLLQPDTQRAFESRKPDVASDGVVDSRVRSRVAAPATGLMVASAFNLLLVAAALLLVVLYAGWDRTASNETLSFTPPGMSYTHTTSPPPPRPVWAVLFPFASAIFVLVPSLLTFISAWRMRRLQGYGMAIVGSVLGILTPPGLVIGTIFGIWALVVLSGREVREAFGADNARPIGKSLLVTCGVVAGIVLLGILTRFGLPMMQKVPGEKFEVVASASGRPAIPGEITQKSLSAAVGGELFLDLESGRVFTCKGTAERPGPELLRASSIDMSVKFEAGEPRIIFWNCSTNLFGGGGLLIESAMQPDFAEPGWGKSLRQVAMELPVPAVDTQTGMESELPTGVLVRTRNGPIALEITRYHDAATHSRQLDLRYVLFPPGGTVPQAQTVFDLNPIIELTIPMNHDGVTNMFDPESGQIIPSTDPDSVPHGQALSSRKGLLIKHDSNSNQTELVGMNGVMTQDSRADQWDEITNLQALETLRKNSMSEGGSVGAVVKGEEPHTFLFKTGTGRIGLLQITGFTENPRGVKIRYKLVQSAEDIPVPAGGFIRQSGTYQLDGGVRLAMTPFSGGRVSFAITRVGGTSRETVSIPDFLKQDGWFVYVDSAARVWIFDGVRQLDVVAPDGRYSAGAHGVRALCPAAVWDAVPEAVRKSYRETQESKPASITKMPIPPEALDAPGPNAADPESHADATSSDPVFTLRWVAKAEDKDAVALPDATKGRVTHADGRVEEETLRVSKTWLLEPSMLREVGWNRWKGFDKSLFLILKNDADILALQEATEKRIAEQIAVVWRGRVIGVLKVEKELSNGIKIPLSLPDDEASAIEKELKAAIISPDRVQIEDLALHMIVAIREKDDAKLKALATDHIKGWPDSLPQFAVEMREHYRQSTGNDRFDMKAGESLFEGDLGLVRCTGPAELKGKCLVLFFVKTGDGWRNHSLRASMEDIPLADFMAGFRKNDPQEKPADGE